jgi:hypothetical protein
MSAIPGLIVKAHIELFPYGLIKYLHENKEQSHNIKSIFGIKNIPSDTQM